MIWALENIDFVGVEGVYAAVARTLATTRALPDTESEGTKESNAGLKTRLSKFCKSLGTVVRKAEAADSAFNTVKKIASDAKGVIDLIEPFIEG
jgi:hypothetical protein